jgi:hypothetical protein
VCARARACVCVQVIDQIREAHAREQARRAAADADDAADAASPRRVRHFPLLPKSSNLGGVMSPATAAAASSSSPPADSIGLRVLESMQRSTATALAVLQARHAASAQTTTTTAPTTPASAIAHARTLEALQSASSGSALVRAVRCGAHFSVVIRVDGVALVRPSMC